MTIFKPSRSKVESGVLIDLGAAGDDAVIKKTVSLVSLDDTVIEGAGSGHVVTVSGTVQSEIGTAISLGAGDPGAAGNRLVVTSSGQVTGTFSGLAAGAVLFGGGSLLENAGKITGAIGIAFGVDAGRTAVLENSGTIFAALGVCRFAGLGTSKLVNSGVIDGLSTSYAGQFGGSLVARDIVINSGLMRGDVILGAGDDLYVGQGKGRVIGEISGDEGNDTFRPGVKAENILGGSGNDVLDFRKVGPVRISIDGDFANTGAAKGDSYSSIDQIWGSNKGGDRISGGTGPETLKGFGGQDTIDGGDGQNFLVGGKGRDVITGGGDTDFFQFNRLADLGDRISNFTADEDLILFAVQGVGLSGFGPAANQFRARSDNQAQDGNDRFIFRTTDKTLWFDRDGNGGNGPVLVADLQQNAILTYQDIVYFLI